MPTAQIKVSFVNQPTGARKSGSVKIDDGSFFNVPVALLGQFQPNGNYTVEYTEKDGTGQWAGRKFRDITRIAAAQAPTPPTGGKYGQTDDTTAERIFVCGALNSAIQAGQINVGDGPAMVQFVTTLRGVWKRTFGSSAKPVAPSAPPPAQSTTPPPRDDMDDEIPF